MAAIYAAAQTTTQKRWTLKECITHAIENNITIKQKDNSRRMQEIQLSTDRNSRLPGVDASIGQNISFGRGLTSQNTYTNTNTSSTSFNIGASLPLFTGMRIHNSIQLDRLNLEAATADLEKAKNDISVQVTEAYVQILYATEITATAHRQTEIDSMQAERIRIMFENGKASESQLSQQKAAMAQSTLTATQAENNLKMAVLTLSQLLELPSPEGFAVEPPDTDNTPGTADIRKNTLPSPDMIYAEATAIKPEIRAETLRLKASDNRIRIARAALYPQLSLNGGTGTNYYTTSGHETDAFGKQIKNNFSQYIGLSLNIPIFNRFATRNSIRAAKIERENQILLLTNTQKNLYKEIQQAYYNTIAAESKYNSSMTAEKSSLDAFTLTKAKYENGKAGITEFNEAKNNWLKAQSDMIQAKYEYMYQKSLIEFYRGKNISF